ncbi:MAG: DUF6473 family protein [Marinosulfonomonas sp.]|nr:DUF6473 family protein [Marinosulfonomonas sp.]
MTYENLGQSALDYFPCRYGKSKLLFRGPRKRMAGEFLAMIGGTETYGKFIEKPFPALVSEGIGVESVNFGCVNAGVDVFSNEPVVIEACVKARVTVVQVVGAQNMSNRFYAVHPRRNDRFLRASTLMKTVFREVDFTDFSFTKHLLSTLQTVSEERFNIVRDELKEAWIARMKLLLDKIEGKTILLWFADRAPDDASSPDGLGRDPLFVDRAMIEAIRPIVTEVVEVVPSAQALAKGTKGMLYSPMEEPAANELMGLMAHEEVARALIEPLRRLI